MRKSLGSVAVLAAFVSLLIIAGCGGKGVTGGASAPGSDRNAAISITDAICKDTGTSNLTVCTSSDQSPACTSEGTVLMSLQRAIELVDCGGTVTVLPGVYTGDLEINKPITLNGANTNTSACSARTSNETTIDGNITLAPNNIAAGDPGPSDVTINGITVTGVVSFTGTSLGNNNNILYTNMASGFGTVPDGSDLSSIGFACTANFADCLGLNVKCAPAALTCQQTKDANVGILQGILDNSGKKGEDAHHIANAIKALKESLDKYNKPKDSDPNDIKWTGDCTLGCKAGAKAIEYERQAVEELEHVTSADVSDIITAIVGVDRQLAVNEIAAAGASCKYLDDANRKLAEGDSKFAPFVGRRAQAIQKYREAWDAASKCVCKGK